MKRQKNKPKPHNLNEDARRIWEANAEWWYDRIGDGNRFQNELIEPATERLLGDIAGQTVLDIACGGGRFARRMAALGARVTAFDFSRRFINRARKRTPAGAAIEYRVLDATDEKALLGLGAGRFDGAVSSMALMDMSDITPLFSALPKLLKPNGWFVFSIQHPCFQNPAFSLFAESSDAGGEYKVQTGVKVSRYLTPGPYQGLGIIGQPEVQWYFHRPLSVLLNAGLARGFVMDGLEEPRFAEAGTDEKYLRWSYITEIPPVLVVRMRAAGR